MTRMSDPPLDHFHMIPAATTPHQQKISGNLSTKTRTDKNKEYLKMCIVPKLYPLNFVILNMSYRILKLKKLLNIILHYFLIKI